MYPTQRIIIYSFNFLQNFRSPTASSFHLLVYLRRYIWTPFAFSRLALCLVINSITLQFFCTPLQSHKRTIHYLKIEILVPNTRSNFDIPHIYSYLSRILNVIINLLRFLQRCRSPSPILTPAPHCSLHRYIIHTLINWSLSKSLVVATSFNKLYLPVTCIPMNLPSISERRSYFGGSMPWTPCIARYQTNGLHQQLMVNIGEGHLDGYLGSLTASDLRHQIAMSNLRYMPGEAWIVDPHLSDGILN